MSGNLLIFTLSDALRALSIFITFPYFSLYVLALGGSTVDIGLVNSLLPIAALFVYPIAGYLADRYDRVKIIAVSGYISAVLYLIFALAPDWRYLALGNFLIGLMVFQFPAMNALMADSLPAERRGVGYSLWIALPSAVGILSPYIGGYLITALGVDKAMKSLYWLSAAVIVGIATMNLKFLKETNTPKNAKASGSGFVKILVDSYRDMIEVLGSLPRNLKRFTFMLVLSFFINNLAAPYWVVYGVGVIGLSKIEWGTVLMVAAVVNTILLVPAGLLVDRIGARMALSFSLAFSVAPILFFPYSRKFMDTMLLFVAITVANTFLISGAPAFMAESVPVERRGRVMAALGQGMLFINTIGGSGGPGMGAILTIPSILGYALGGFLYSYDPKLLWILLALSMLVNAAICLIFLGPSTHEMGPAPGGDLRQPPSIRITPKDGKHED